MPRFEIGTRGLVLLAVGLALEAALIFLLGWHFGSQHSGSQHSSNQRAGEQPSTVRLSDARPAGVRPPVARPASPRLPATPQSAVRTSVPTEGSLPAAAAPAGRAARGLAGGGDVGSDGVEAGGSEPAAGDAAADGPPRFVVKVGAFVLEEELQAVLEKLRARGLSVYVTQSFNSAGNPLHEVWLGPFGTRAEAEREAAEAAEVAGRRPLIQMESNAPARDAGATSSPSG
jgi:cell division septation protein DedD